jgi:glycerophosphoryl diester phosphodiesterase
MDKAWAHAKAHGAVQPSLSPVDATVLSGDVPVKELQAKGFRIVPWTTNDPGKIRAVIRTGVDGLISDRPDLLQQVLHEELAAAKTPEERTRLARFDVTAHRGGRGLRPENTLPSFESGLDQLVTTLETDTGVTTDSVSLIWHDQFLSPESCRRADGAPYTLENRVFTKDISSAEAQKTFICDKLHFGDAQKNDLALSPVAVAFAKQEGLMSPYVPTYAAQLFRFVNFYVAYYRTGASKAMPHAKERAENAAKVRFNIETKIMPDAIATDEAHRNHTVGPQAFVDALCGAIVKNGMEARAEVQSFDFRTLVLVEEQHPKIPTYYLTGSPKSLSSPLVPEALRADGR